MIEHSSGLDPREDHEWLGYGMQWITDADVAAVVSALKSPYLTQGPRIAEFEQNICNAVSAPHAVAVNSATAALHIACLAMDLKPGDEVITTPITFVASANCAVYCGATPVFADVDPRTALIKPDSIERLITARTRAIIPVHFAGQCADMKAIREIADRATKKFGHRIFIIEDAAHAIGGSYAGAPVGSCQFSDATVFSFHPVKQITTGEGGALSTRNPELARRYRVHRSHGITSEPSQLENKAPPPWWYEQQDIGYNYRITDIQSALGSSQLARLPQFIKQRQEIATLYRRRFSEIEGIDVLDLAPNCEHAWHLFVILSDFNRVGGRAQAVLKLRERKITAQVHYIPVTHQPFFQKRFGTKVGQCPGAEAYYSKCLSIPLFPAMSDGDIQRTLNEVRDVAAK